MTTFDTDLVGRWFDLLLDLDSPADSTWGVHLHAAELEAVRTGGRAISAAVGWSELPSQLPTPADHAAAVLQVYLAGMATGIAGARETMAQNGDLDEVDVADRLCLAAGLIAGGAAVQVAPDDLPAGGTSGAGAADLARAAGTAAAELVVDGADLHSITSAAAAAAMAAGPPDAANRDPRYRARAVVALVLVALQRSTAPAGAPVQPPSCGAVPGGNNGVALLAEVTFTTFLPPEECGRLQATLTGLAEEVVMWSEGDKRYFHVHTEVAGEVIAEAFAVGAVFSLVVGRLD
ncbi:hypothetical protein ABIB25_004605 [Nakamurella sp. UYEF19]|uniref:hypothetical protein n=1 Tax=Nakamurella sp. UYEF19 TaxID=1756392 RepID=UPI00339904CA